MLNNSPFFFFFICGTIGLFFWYKMLGIISNKGIKVNYFIISLSSFSDFAKIIKEETNRKLKRSYRFILWIQLLLIPVYIIGMIILLNY